MFGILLDAIRMDTRFSPDPVMAGDLAGQSHSTLGAT